MKNKKIIGLMIFSSFLLVGCESSGKMSFISSENSSSISASSSEVETSSSSSTSSSTSIELEEFSRYEYFPLLDGNLAIGVGQNKYLEKLTIPQMHDGKVVTKIAGSGFSGCTSLKEIEIPNSITEIMENAFNYCTSLTSVTIPSSVTTIGSYAFSGCVSLATIYCEAESRPNGWDSNWEYGVNSNVIWDYFGDNGIYDEEFSYAVCGNQENKYIKITKYNGIKVEVTIPKSINSLYVTTIESCAFNNCTSLTSITIPSSVITIGRNAFEGCTSLTTIYCEAESQPKGWDSNWKYNPTIKVIWGYIKSGIYDGFLYDICISNEKKYVTITGYKEKKTKIEIPSIINEISVTTIREWSFSNCSSLTNIIIPSSVTTIRKRAFYNCTSLTSITIPSSVTTISEDAFLGCTSLTTIYCEAESQPKGWDSNWKYSANANVIWDYFGGNGIYNEEFSYAVCGNQKNKYIKITKYSGSKENVAIPESIEGLYVTTIDSRAFEDCTSLISVTIPNSVTAIGEWAFSGCTSITTIYCEVESQPKGWASNWLIGTNAKVAWGCVGSSTYNDFTYDICISDGNKYLAITGYNGKNSEIEIPSIINEINVTTIRERAFYNCTSITSITISSSVTTISKNAFLGCTSITSITIPSSVTTIGECAFEDCTSLTTIYCETESRPKGWDSNWNGYATSNIVWDYFGGNGIYDEEFSYAVCGNQKNKYIKITKYSGSKGKVIIPKSIDGLPVTTINRKAFNNCRFLTSLTIPNSVTTISEYAFNGCKSLASIEIPSSVTTIGTCAFLGCESLKSITIPSSVTTIGGSVFYNCTILTTVYCEAESQPEGWNAYWLTGTTAKVKWGVK